MKWYVYSLFNLLILMENNNSIRVRVTRDRLALQNHVPTGAVQSAQTSSAPTAVFTSTGRPRLSAVIQVTSPNKLNTLSPLLLLLLVDPPQTRLPPPLALQSHWRSLPVL